jgi:hypothetical protein
MSARIRRAGAALLATTFAALPHAAAACAVCGGNGDEPSRGAYIATTAVLSLLPLGMIGGVVLWIWRRTRGAAGGRP